jgi:hypothetical protein
LFGVVLAFLKWQLVVTRRSIRDDRESVRREVRDETEPPTDCPDQKPR